MPMSTGVIDYETSTKKSKRFGTWFGRITRDPPREIGQTPSQEHLADEDVPCRNVQVDEPVVVDVLQALGNLESDVELLGVVQCDVLLGAPLQQARVSSVCKPHRKRHVDMAHCA